MLQLTLAYIQQADREREIATELTNRQALRSTAHASSPVKSPATTTNRSARSAPVRVRAASR
jgi:hypothetical protein